MIKEEIDLCFGHLEDIERISKKTDKIELRMLLIRIKVKSIHNIINESICYEDIHPDTTPIFTK